MTYKNLILGLAAIEGEENLSVAIMNIESIYLREFNFEESLIRFWDYCS